MPDVISPSILNSVKKNLGIDPSYEAYDVDIKTHINSVFSILHQLGIGPAGGYFIESNADKWEDFFEGDDPLLSMVKTYMTLKVRLWFDQAGMTSRTIESMENQIQELEGRINFIHERRAG